MRLKPLEDIAINLQHPRHIDGTLTPEFIQISRQVLPIIREETLKSMEYLKSSKGLAIAHNLITKYRMFF